MERIQIRSIDKGNEGCSLYSLKAFYLSKYEYKEMVSTDQILSISNIENFPCSFLIYLLHILISVTVHISFFFFLDLMSAREV